jgi:ribosome-binding factor A
MPAPRRIDRINSLLQEEISLIIQRELKDPRLGFISVTGVETSSDLRHAKVRVSVMGSDDQKKDTLAGLARAAGFIHETVLRRIEIRRMPQLEFVLDRNIEYSMHINEVLSSLNNPPGDGNEP